MQCDCLHILKQEIKDVQSLPHIHDEANFHQLVEMLRNGYKNSIYNFEANYLHQFKRHLYPNETFQVRSTIKWIVRTHGLRRKMIRTQVMTFETVDYSYTYNNEKRYFKFHNDMELHEDMLILLYLHNVISPIDYKIQPVQRLLQLMHKKYMIRDEHDDLERDEKSEHLITIYRLTVLFPSISVTMFHENMCTIAKQTAVIFQEIPNLPKAMYHHLMPMLIPHSTGKPPLALLMFITRKYLFIYQEKQPSVVKLYKYIKKLYRSNIYPEELKVRLCIYWNIVEQYDKKLFISHTIMNCNEYAKGMLVTNMNVLASNKRRIMDLSCKL